MKIAVCSGTFDPITLGHVDLIQRASQRFDKIWVCVSPNAQKTNQMFTPEEKLRMVQLAVAEYANVEAELYDGLLADYAVEHGAQTIIRGVRNATDFDMECQLATINRGIHPQLDTWLLPASAQYGHFSSSMAREMIRYGQPLDRYLPQAVVALVQDKFQKQEG